MIKRPSSILCLDQATNTGFSHWEVGVRVEIGSHNLSWCGDNIGKFLSHYEKWLRALMIEKKVDYLCFEAPILNRKGLKITSIEVAKKLLSIATLIEKLCWELDVRCSHVESGQWRKHFIGSGGYPTEQAKDMAMKKCRACGFSPKNHDEAESFGILDFIATLLNLPKDWKTEGAFAFI